MIFEGTTSHPLEAFKQATYISSSSLVSPNCRTNPAASSNQHSWEPPQVNFVKIDVDGAIFYDLEKARIGVIVRDRRGQAILAASLAKREVDKSESI